MSRRNYLFLFVRYSLTDEGLALAERLHTVEQRSKGVSKEVEEKEEEEVQSDTEEKVDPPRVVDLTGSDDGEESDDSSSQHGLRERLACAKVTDGPTSKGDQKAAAVSRKPSGGHLPPGSYDIVLCVDFIETTG